MQTNFVINLAVCIVHFQVIWGPGKFGLKKVLGHIVTFFFTVFMGLPLGHIELPLTNVMIHLPKHFLQNMILFQGFLIVSQSWCNNQQEAKMCRNASLNYLKYIMLYSIYAMAERCCSKDDVVTVNVIEPQLMFVCLLLKIWLAAMEELVGVSKLKLSLKLILTHWPTVLNSSDADTDQCW